MPVVAIAEITHLSKHDTVAGEGLAICPHMSSYVSICPRLSQSGQAVNSVPEQAHWKTLQNLFFQAENARVSPKLVIEFYIQSAKLEKRGAVMGKMMEYNGYHAQIEYDAEDELFIGK